jgi:hypothetical protein
VLTVRYHQLSDVLEYASVDLREHLFELLLQVMQSSYELGQHAAPEGRSAREVRSDRSGARARAVVSAVRIYLEAHPELGPLRTSEKFALVIQPDILELLNLPKAAPSPSVGAIRRALSSVKESRRRGQ